MSSQSSQALGCDAQSWPAHAATQLAPARRTIHGTVLRVHLQTQALFQIAGKAGGHYSIPGLRDAPLMTHAFGSRSNTSPSTSYRCRETEYYAKHSAADPGRHACSERHTLAPRRSAATSRAPRSRLKDDTRQTPPRSAVVPRRNCLKGEICAKITGQPGPLFLPPKCSGLLREFLY